MLGEPQPYSKTFGNVVNYMMRSLTIMLSSEMGLFCSESVYCAYNLGGLFVTTSIDKLLFHGFSDPFTLKYLDLKHAQDNVTFSCINSPYLSCGVKNYNCGVEGVRITVAGNSIDLAFGTSNESILFQPYLYFNKNGNVTFNKNDYLTKVTNPLWTAFPAATSTDEEFLKWYNCLGSIFFGPENEFVSCASTLDSGASDTSKLFEMIKYRGNSSIDQVASPVAVQGTSDLLAQATPLLWDAIYSYPYPYLFSYSGTKHHAIPTPVIFDESTTVSLQYSQSQLLSVDRETAFNPKMIFQNYSMEDIINVQRFTEDPRGWALSASEEGVPLDSYGMPYQIPIGMASIGHLTGFPMFIGTPENYGMHIRFELIWSDKVAQGISSGVGSKAAKSPVFNRIRKLSSRL